jgi:hypothetical protein
VPNAVISKIGTDGKVCVFNLSATDVIVDVGGYAPVTAQFKPITPARLLDTRAGGATIDGNYSGVGALEAGQEGELPIAGRGGVPDGVVATAINVTVSGASAPGFITVWPCDGDRPASSNVNYGPGTTTANLVMPGLSGSGSVCFYSLSRTDLIVDVSGYFPA